MLLAMLSIGRTRPPGPPAEVHQHWAALTAADVDAALRQLAGHRLIIDTATASGLNLALARMMRAGLLADVETGVLIEEQVPYLARLGLPPGRPEQWELATSAPARLVGVVKDDSGGVCVSGATLTPWTPGTGWWVRAVVDDQRLCDGSVRSLTLTRLGPAELSAEVRLGRFRTRTQRGRSLQLACDEAQIVTDGVGRERPRSKRTFWSEPELWQLATPG